MKEIVAHLLGADLDYTATSNLMRQTGAALVSGGEVAAAPGQPASLALPPAPTPEIGAQLGLQPGLIDALMEAALGLLSTPLGSPQIPHKLSLLLAAGAAFHVAADKGTQLLAAHLQAQKEALERERDSTSAVRKILTVVTAQSRELTTASQELSTTSQQMQSHAKQTSSQAGMVSAASKRITDVVQSLALATEQLNASIREISSSASAAAKTTSSALKIVAETNQAVLRLGQSSTDIGQVVKVIRSVAGQTNLLALNATIEAARAGGSRQGLRGRGVRSERVSQTDGASHRRHQPAH
jgi:methyl-accepting chemotaxis protein